MDDLDEESGCISLVAEIGPARCPSRACARGVVRSAKSRMNLPTCHQYIPRKSQFPNICDTGLATLLTTGVEKSQIASGRRSVGISQQNVFNNTIPSTRSRWAMAQSMPGEPEGAAATRP